VRGEAQNSDSVPPLASGSEVVPMATHTPGPWNAVRSSDGDWWVEGPSWVFSANNDAGLEREADARHIAAVPEMADLLDWAAAMRLQAGDPADAVVVRDQARALLRHIRGES
jgi:hypothetical protein